MGEILSCNRDLHSLTQQARVQRGMDDTVHQTPNSSGQSTQAHTIIHGRELPNTPAGDQGFTAARHRCVGELKPSGIIGLLQACTREPQEAG
jgi:hypothetical protein